MSDPTSSPPPLPTKRTRVPRVLWFVLCVSLLLNLATCAMIVSPTRLAGVREYPDVTRTLAYGPQLSDTHVAVLDLSGTILRDAPASLIGEKVDPVTKLLMEIQAATVDENVRAILLEVNSPGGGVTASDEIYRKLMEFRESDPDRKIVVLVKDMAASGGYYAALAADVIVAQPTAVVGSVGVMLNAVNLSGLGDKLGVRDASLVSSENKALLNPLEPVDPEHQAILQEVVDDLYGRFRELVLERRPFDAAFAEKFSLLDGRIFTAPRARELGLVDETGYADLARRKVMDLLGDEDVGFYEMDYAGGWRGLFAVKAPEFGLPARLGSRFLYLWTP